MELNKYELLNRSYSFVSFDNSSLTIAVKNLEDNDTVGIIICKRDDKYVIEYCSDERIIVREYELVWYNKYRWYYGYKKENRWISRYYYRSRL